MDPAELGGLIATPGPSGLEGLGELAEVIPGLVDVVPVEALPVDALPVYAVTWITRLLLIFARHALLLAFIGAAIENTILLGFLLPGGVVVALSGAGARAAGVPLPLLVVAAALGMTAGAVADYYMGKAGIHRLLHQPWTGRFGRRLARQLDNAEPLLRRHGWWMMLFAHAFGHGRSSMALAAGASRFPLGRFLAIEFPAALLWSALYAGGGYLLGREWDKFELVLRRAGWVGAAALIAGGLAWWLWHRRQPKDSDEDEPANGRVQASAASVAPDPAPATVTSAGSDGVAHLDGTPPVPTAHGLDGAGTAARPLSERAPAGGSH
jgi:membrane protein DedA with SNARE-associated domain